jgi:Rieske Fe-S protein
LEPNPDQPNVPGPSLWPIGFAIGVACILVGLVVSTPAVIAGTVIAVICAVLWARDAARGHSAPPAVEPETALTPVPAAPAAPVAEDGETETYSRSVFLEGATLGLGAVIGGIIVIPALGFMIAPAFVDQEAKRVDVGPLSDFPEGQYTITTFLRDPAQGEVTRRTAFIRNNGLLNDVPSFTILSNRCAHLGCPVQPGGPIFEDKKKTATSVTGEEVTIIPMLPAGGFVCPCHGGTYDREGNRVAGPPVRALDRYEFEILNGRLVLLGTFSVAKVSGTGSSAEIKKTTLQDPGEPVEGIESWMYPLQPPR